MSKGKKSWWLDLLESKAVWYIGLLLILVWIVFMLKDWLFGKGGVFDTFWTWAGSTATSIGYNNAVAKAAPALNYDLARSAAMKAHGMDYQQYKAAYYDKWPTKAEYAAGKAFP